MAGFDLVSRLAKLKGLGISIEYGDHILKEELNEGEPALNSEDEFAAEEKSQPQAGDDASPFDAGNDAWNTTVHSTVEKRHVPMKIEKSILDTPPLDCLKFIVGEPAEETIDFCAWKVVLAYPWHYIGKTNRPRAQPYFDKILEGRVWDFFYLYNPESPTEEPRLLVPTVQLENFLRAINRELGTSLAIPGGTNQDKFYMRFGEGATPRPRYLQRSRDQKRLKVESFPAFDKADGEGFKATSRTVRQEWMKNWQMMVPRAAVKKKDASRKAAQRKFDRERMLDESQAYLGLKGKGSRQDVVFVCMDVEAIEMSPNSISEIGIAILDFKDLEGVEAGPGGQNWWQFIQAHHLRTKEYSGLVNNRFVQGCPSHFDFGVSTFPEVRELPDAIGSILAPCIAEKRQLVFVGHDARQDIKYLSSIGFDVLALRGLVDQLDTKEIHQAWKGSDQGRSLAHILGDLFIHSKHLHNAGNDAVFTLRGLVGMAIEQIREKEAEAKGEEYKPALMDVKEPEPEAESKGVD